MNRSYGSDELKYIEQELHKRYRIGDVFATHIPCSHRYRVKKGGRKEQQIIESENSVMDDQTCSICFKLRCDTDNPMIEEINIVKEKDGQEPDLQLLKVKHNFYQWLYERVN
jgi:hypothetical protein